MGYYLQIDTEDAQPLASLTGWGDVIAWTDTLPAKSASAIKHLCQFGWQEQVVLLKIEIEECLKSAPPKDPQTKATVENFLALLKAHTEPAVVVSVTDGLGGQ